MALIYCADLRCAIPASQENYVFARQMLKRVLAMPPAYQALVMRLFNGFSEAEIAEKSGHTLRQVKAMRLDLRRLIGDVGVDEYDKFAPTGVLPEPTPISKPKCAPAAIRAGCVLAHSIFSYLRDENRWVGDADLIFAFKLTGNYDLHYLQVPLTALEASESIKIVQEREGKRTYRAIKRPRNLYGDVRSAMASLALAA